MSDRHQYANRFPWPPVIYVVAIALALVVETFAPLPWIAAEPLAGILFAIGVLIMVAGLALDAQALRGMRKAGTTAMVTRASDHLVTSGAFALSRNPIYLGMTMLVLGAGLVFAMPWLLVAAVAAAFVTQKVTIEAEEKHLALKFGKKYRDYSRKVRRWF